MRKRSINKVIAGTAINVGPISIPVTTLISAVATALRGRTAKSAAFTQQQIDESAVALSNAVKWLLHDRVDEGTGSGGWGHSDADYMSFLYGDGEQITDSVMTTVVVACSLFRFAGVFDSPGTELNGFRPERWEDPIWQGVREYSMNRWNPRTGMGGTLKMGREGDPVIAPRYRHTAWLVRLWLKLPGCRRNIPKTVEALIGEFKHVGWDTEKVATSVAASAAIRAVCQAEDVAGVVDLAKLDFLNMALLDLTKQKYNSEIHGWTSGTSAAKGRNLYTLFVLAEMASDWMTVDGELRGYLGDALRHTLTVMVNRDADTCYVPFPETEDADVNSSFLTLAALVKKPELDEFEQNRLAGLSTYISRLMIDPGQLETHTLYAWAVSYYVEAMCELLSTGD